MSPGTKNRINHNATLCRDHLRNAHRDKLALVNEFITEKQDSDGDVSWNQFTDLKRSERGLSREEMKWHWRGR